MATRFSLLLQPALALPLLALLACKPDASAKRAQWNAAVGQRNGAAAWHVLDSGTRERILEGLKRSQAKAKGDPAFQRLFAEVCAPADSAQPPEVLAQALLSHPELALPVDDSVPGTWPPEPVGFCTPDGCPLTLAIRTHPSLAPPAGTSYRLVVDFNGKTSEEVARIYASDIQTLAPRQHWSPVCAAQMARVMAVYFDELIPRGAFNLTFEIGGDASLTAVFEAFNPSTFSNQSKAEPKLAYAPWPGA